MVFELILVAKRGVILKIYNQTNYSIAHRAPFQTPSLARLLLKIDISIVFTIHRHIAAGLL